MTTGSGTVPRENDDRGFTLVELLLAIAVLVIILASLSSALIVFLKNGTETLQRDDHSGGAAIMASYLDRDIASAETITPNGDECAGSGNLMTFRWQDVSATPAAPTPVKSGPVFTTAYRLADDPSSGADRRKLVRVACSGTTVTDTATLVLNLAADRRPTAPTLTAVGADVCPSLQRLTFTLPSYGGDNTEAYTFQACTATRLDVTP